MNKLNNDSFLRLIQGAAQVLPAGELEKKVNTGKPLCIKLGADPTAPDLHLGHAVVLSKLRQFQDEGHRVVFIVGDFTARIGDPTGKSKTRPPLDEETISANSATYLAQVTRILDPHKTTIVHNSEWLSKISLAQFLTIAGKTTLARIIEREDFMNRFKNNVTIGFHELMYPLLQGYDSVAIQADVELGGTDQTFNLLMGRYLQEQFGQEGQVVLTTPLLEGLDGVQKMSKSLGNYIGLRESADQAFGKLMSISDTLMWRYYELLTTLTPTEVAAKKAAVSSGTLHPLTCKKEMAHAIVRRFWSAEEAVAGQESFEALFQKKDYSNATAVTITSSETVRLIGTLLKEIGAVASSSEARRLVEAGAVTIEGTKVASFDEAIAIVDGMVIKVGKHRIYRLTLAA